MLLPLHSQPVPHWNFFNFTIRKNAIYHKMCIEVHKMCIGVYKMCIGAYKMCIGAYKICIGSYKVVMFKVDVLHQI